MNRATMLLPQKRGKGPSGMADLRPRENRLCPPHRSTQCGSRLKYQLVPIGDGNRTEMRAS